MFCALFCAFTNTAFTQEFNPVLNVGAKFGFSKLLGETDFSRIGNEFYNHPGMAFDFEVSKYLTPHLEIGVEIERSVLNGENDQPYFSADGIHSVHLVPIINPIEYQNKLTGQNLFFRVFLRPTNQKYKFAPFLKAGIGYKYYKSELKFKETPKDPEVNQLIFGKGIANQANLSTAVFISGLGFKTSLSEQVYLLANFDVNMVNYDFLDVVHNYDRESKDRLDLYGIYTQFKIGIFYTLKGEPIEKKSIKESRKKQSPTTSTYLPFAPK